jgi:hypothetical protein
MSLARMRLATTVLGVAILMFTADRTLAQSTEQKPADQHQQGGEGNKDGQKKIDEYAEAEQLLGGPAASAECLWLGWRVVSLLWRDDLDTAFRHLDLYDRFGCPAGHIQAAFRCVIRQGDPKQTDTVQGRVHACWINPNLDPNAAVAAPSASAVPPTQSR